MMKKLKSFLGYTWAAAAIIIAPATFLGHTYFSHAIATATGVTVHPRFSGGGVIKTIDHGGYITSMHRPVFDALFGRTHEGFIQIKWEPAAALPQVITEGFDYDGDSRDDFMVTLNTATGETALTKRHPAVLDHEKSYRLRNGWAVRVMLKR
ncbi:MAG: hypothetical protein JXA41_09185 [Deltaproteobacteria bacterium]|nr:hypothetical protein [Deltaproteobacteria bacterium]